MGSLLCILIPELQVEQSLIIWVVPIMRRIVHNRSSLISQQSISYRRFGALVNSLAYRLWTSISSSVLESRVTIVILLSHFHISRLPVVVLNLLLHLDKTHSCLFATRSTRNFIVCLAILSIFWRGLIWYRLFRLFPEWRLLWDDSAFDGP
jgi:hypothetical protein